MQCMSWNDEMQERKAQEQKEAEIRALVARMEEKLGNRPLSAEIWLRDHALRLYEKLTELRSHRLVIIPDNENGAKLDFEATAQAIGYFFSALGCTEWKEISSHVLARGKPTTVHGLKDRHSSPPVKMKNYELWKRLLDL